MSLIALVDKVASGIDYSKFFNFEFDEYFLSTDTTKKKLLVRDIDKDMIEAIKEEYDKVILVGADANNHVAKLKNVATIQGHIYEDKYLPISSYKAVKIHPANEPAFLKAIESINEIITGEKRKEVSLDLQLLDDKAEEYLTFLLDSNINTIAVDTETSGLSFVNDNVIGISISHKEKQGVYIPYLKVLDLVDLLSRLFKEKHIVFHNAKFDMHHIKATFEVDPPDSWDDTMMMHYVLDESEGSHGLKTLALKYTDMGDYEAELDEWKNNFVRANGIKKSEFSYEEIPVDIIYKYAATDTAVTLELYNKFKPLVNKGFYKIYENLLKKGMMMLWQVEENGVPFDVERLEKAKSLLTKKLSSLTLELYENKRVKDFEQIQGMALNLNSVNQLRSLLFNTLGLTPSGIMTDTGEHSLNAESLEIISKQDKIANIILDIRKLTKILNTYITKILANIDYDKRLRTGFNLTTTTSGRLSSSGNLNLQQLPREGIGAAVVKGSLKAKEGYKIISQD